MGSRAFEMAGDVVISSSRSGEGEAFRFLEGLAEDTSNVDVSVSKMTGRESNLLDLLGESRVCSWKWGGTGGVARLFIMAGSGED